MSALTLGWDLSRVLFIQSVNWLTWLLFLDFSFRNFLMSLLLASSGSSLSSPSPLFPLSLHSSGPCCKAAWRVWFHRAQGKWFARFRLVSLQSFSNLSTSISDVQLLMRRIEEIWMWRSMTCFLISRCFSVLFGRRMSKMGRVSAEKKRRPEFPSVEVPPVEPVLCASLFYQKQLQ